MYFDLLIEPSVHIKMPVILMFALVGRITVNYTCHKLSFTSPNYLDAVVQKCCIRKCPVRREVHVRHVFKSYYNWTKHDMSIKHSCVLLCYKDFHRKTVDCLKVATSSKQLNNGQL